MAVATVDDLLGGRRSRFYKIGAATVANRWYSPFYVAGGAAVAPTPGVAGAALTSYAGQLPFTNPTGGAFSYLSRFGGEANIAGTLVLADRLWHNSGLSVTINTSQTVNSVAFPARDMNGEINGADVMIGIEVSTVMGAGTPTVTLGYTNQLNTAGRSIVTPALPATMAVGSFIPIAWAAGDAGVKSIQNFQLSATMTSGALHLVAYRILAEVGLSVPNVGNYLDALQLGLPRLYDNTVPFLLWLPTTTTAPTLQGSFTVAQK